jgi:IS5 family transposase
VVSIWVNLYPILKLLERLLKEINAVPADKGYASTANRTFLARCGLKDGILHKAQRGSSLTTAQKQFNRAINTTRFRVEKIFGKFNYSEHATLD